MRMRRNVGLVAVLAAAGCLPDYPVDRFPHGSGYGAEDEAVPPPAPAAPKTGAPPEFGPTVTLADAPPPLSGGTLAVAADGVTVVAADPDRDRVYVLDHRSAASLRTIGLSIHDEPGRVVIDDANRAHVALRGGGAVVTIDLATATVIARRDVCSAPRGIAYDAANDAVHVACAGGELVTLPASGGPEVRRRMLYRDLRDVVVVPGGLAVSTFRDAKILRLAEGSDIVVERSLDRSAMVGIVPRVAWRMIAAPRSDGSTSLDDSDGIMMAAQTAPADGSATVPQAPPAYYETVDPAPCAERGPAPLLVDRLEAIHVPNAVLPVDVAATDATMAIVAAGNGHTPSMPQLFFFARRNHEAPQYSCSPGAALAVPAAQLTSVAFVDGGKTAVALSREPAALLVISTVSPHEVSRITLSTDSREDTGHAIFHSSSGAGVACASCHPDGRDDGHSWRSLDLGARRTPSLLGTLKNTAPYHWNGEAADMKALMQITFESRMRGPVLADDRVSAMTSWLAALPAPPAAKPADAVAASRGKALFEGEARCATCHGGAMKTNNASVDVRTGGVFQVPSLVGVGWRAPYLHDGSVRTVRALLERSHGGATLLPQQISDVNAYVDTF
jgi:mono/diheme cytochrome c family protein